MDQRLLAQILNTAQSANASREFVSALWWCDKALELAPKVPEVLFHRGIALAGLGRRREAIDSLINAANATLDSADAQNTIGLSLLEVNAFEEAQECLSRSIALAPGYAFPYVNLGKLFAMQKRFDEAARLLSEAVELQPTLFEAHANLGGVLRELYRFAEAEKACLKALELNHNFPQALNNYGLVLVSLNKREAAADAFLQAIALDGSFFDAYNNLGNVYYRLKRYSDAVECFKTCLELNPDAEGVYGALLIAKMMMCDWDHYDEDLQELIQEVDRGVAVANPFLFLAKSADPSLQRRFTELYIAAKFPANTSLGTIPQRPRKDRLRIGYFSADFRNHPVSNLMTEVYELHDRSRFELFAFSWGGNEEDAVRERVRVAFEHFIEVDAKSDIEVAELARSLEIDVAVDLGGHTEHARPGIFAFRVAPIQVGYLGYLGTMGASYIDYLMADPVLVPMSHRKFYTEKIAYLPVYQANDSKRVISDRMFHRQELLLPEQGFVFCCFNNCYKINPEIFRVWMRILRRVEHSVLYLYAENLTAAENLRREVQKSEIDVCRVIITTDRLRVPEYLARYQIADLFLDTVPYNAGTTASDALWAGLPVLTCSGQTMAGRMAASLLQAVGLPELITTDLHEYEDLAVALAHDLNRLDEIRSRLSQNRMTASLFDSKLFSRRLESLFEVMDERYQAGSPPDHVFSPYLCE